MKTPVSIFWFRRDLRLTDNAGLYHALSAEYPVVPVFIFDTHILDDLEEKEDKRVDFIHRALTDMQRRLGSNNSSFHIFHSTPLDSFKQITELYNVASVYTNEDYEPYACKRDKEVGVYLKDRNIPFHSYKDQVIFEKDEIIKDNGQPYTIYTPYSRKWKENLNSFYMKPYPTEKFLSNFYRCACEQIPSLPALGFKKTDLQTSPAMLDEAIAIHYHQTRDLPGMQGTTRLSVHLRFGTISIRRLVAQCLDLNATLLNELIWREFYQYILWHYPQVVTHSFKKEYDNIQWRNDNGEFDRWCKGATGYPIVDAGMRELNATGFMHNRVRMITASFLTKDLLIDWRWGEAYFGKKLLDYDLAANNGGWQWAAGTGCDAAPYFRVFNPYLQTRKFDPELKYIRQWIPELDELNYPPPMVSHDMARKRALSAYKIAIDRDK